jgi:4-amino-4-deoxy-L-arabinose transferase-like glycosyltransferase
MKRTIEKSPRNYLSILLQHKYLILFFVLILVGLYLRFYSIETVTYFMWDQTRDSWQVRNILEGKLVLNGPRTGIGHFHLGPLYFYFLAPFYFLTRLDPIGSIYFNIFANIFNFLAIFYVTKKIFSEKAALFTSFVYIVSHYLIVVNQSPWNVSLVPGVTVLIYYALYQIYQKKYRYMMILGALCGFFFHLHFTGIFLFPIVFVSLLFHPEKKIILKWTPALLGLWLAFLIPNIIYDFSTSNSDYFRVQNFWNDYYHGFHLRFFLHRAHDAFLQFETILYFPILKLLKFILPILFCILIFFEKDKGARLKGLLMIPWFVIPWIGFTVYSGPISDYYFLITVPFVLWILVYLQKKALQRLYVPTMIILVVFWGVYAFFNTQPLWNKPTKGGLASQRAEAVKEINAGKVYEYEEGEIKSYFYTIWKEDKMPSPLDK